MNGSDTTGYDKSKMKMNLPTGYYGFTKTQSRKGVGFVSYNVVPPPPTGLFAPLTIDYCAIGLRSSKPDFKGYGPKASKSVCKDTSNEVKKTLDTLNGSLQLPSKGMDGKWE
ncbi:hypothetical protein Tco_0744163 [Tanacetum coccineum]